ncbi:MAG: transporter, Spinster family, sphingosine-phosphate transporter [Chthoniobacter sp.]|nr:transporter, Spinster family, sphingosine-phosphate transporter [Chthoniobacter sp.]
MSSIAVADEKPVAGARGALRLLLAINLFNYIDRYILAAVEPEIRRAFFAPGDPTAMAKTGSLATAFLVSYMLAAPVFGWIADRTSRWKIVGLSVALWSVATAGSGLAATFTILFATRLFVGLGEAGYGPCAPTIIADFFPLKVRGRNLAYFYLAIPVGSALGFALGGKISGFFHSWRYPFYLMAAPGIALAIACFFMREAPRTSLADHEIRFSFAPYFQLLKNRSYLLNTLAMTAMTFAIGGLSFWIPSYIFEFRHQPDLGAINLHFGVITVAAGLIATLLGGVLGDRLRERYDSAYFLLSGVAMSLSFPFVIAFLYVPFPWAWICIFFAVFFLFLNTGPSNTALANVTHPSVRATAFALNIFIIHAAGDALSPPLIGAIAGRWNMNAGFLAVSAAILLASVLWFRAAPHLPGDTARALDVP